jgi:orotate phosphoribosyltransferase
MSDVIDILKQAGAVLTEDHFVYTSGKHGSVYINKDAVYPHIAKTSEIGKLFAQKFQDKEIDVVVGPALGGIILSQWTAYHLSKLKGREILGVYTEKDEHKNQVFTRGYDALVAGKNVLIVEDVTNTGGSVKKVATNVAATGAKVVAIGVMVNRDPKNVTTETMGVAFESLGVLEAVAYDEKDCPMCKSGKPVNVKVGHGKKYMEAKKL